MILHILHGIKLCDLKTGDILLFGDNRIVMRDCCADFRSFIYRLTEEVLWELVILLYSRYWYHIALVVEKKDIPSSINLPSELHNERLFLLEARLFHGVVLNSLIARINDRPERIAVRQLLPKLSKKHLKYFQNATSFFFNKPFEKNIWEFINSFLDFRFLSTLPPDTSSVFCPEMVAEVLKRSCVISDDKPSHEFVPDNFAERSKVRKNHFFWKYNKPLSMLCPYVYSPEIIIKQDHLHFVNEKLEICSKS